MITYRNILHYYVSDVLEGLSVMKGVLDPQGILPYEKETIDKIGSKVGKHENKLIGKIGNAIDDIDPSSERSVSRNVKKIEGYIRDYADKAATLSSETVYNQSKKFYKAVMRGNEDKFDYPYSYSQADELAIERVNTYQDIFIGDHYRDNVTESVSNLINRTIEENGGVLDRRAIARKLKDEMPEYIKQRGYYETVVAQVLNNSRSYSALNFYDSAGILKFEVIAVMDERTSKQCQYMNGQVLEVSVALRRYAAYDDATSPDDVKAIHPWLSSNNDGVFLGDKLLYEGMTGEDLQALGVDAPPYHGRCRTTVAPLF